MLLCVQAVLHSRARSRAVGVRKGPSCRDGAHPQKGGLRDCCMLPTPEGVGFGQWAAGGTKWVMGRVDLERLDARPEMSLRQEWLEGLGLHAGLPGIR